MSSAEMSGAPDAGADLDTTDTSTESGGEAVSGLDTSAANDNAGGETQAERQERLRLKWLGREEEIDDPRKLAERFSDEYEYEFKGPGGKPIKARWPDIERHVQLSAGAKAAIQRAKEEQAQWRSQVDWGKAPENRLAALEQLWGLEDAGEWVKQQAFELVKREQELAELATTDQYRYHQAMQQQFNERMSRKQKWEQAQSQQRQQQEQRRAEFERMDQQLSAELKGAGIPVNQHTKARAVAIAREHGELGIQLEPRQMAYELRKQLDAEWHQHFDGMPTEKLLSYLGEQRRAKLREAELAATKAAKKAQASNGNGASQKKAEPADMFDKAIKNFMRGA